MKTDILHSFLRSNYHLSLTSKFSVSFAVTGQTHIKLKRQNLKLMFFSSQAFFMWELVHMWYYVYFYVYHYISGVGVASAPHLARDLAR